MNPERTFLAVFLASLLGYGGLGSLRALRSQLSSAGLSADTRVLHALAIGYMSPDLNGLYLVAIGFSSADRGGRPPVRLPSYCRHSWYFPWRRHGRR